MMILARADDRPRALSREATPPVERIITRRTGGGEVSRERRERIYDTSCRHFDITITRSIEDLSYDVGRDTPR
jgi:hypothetical protein